MNTENKAINEDQVEEIQTNAISLSETSLTMDDFKDQLDRSFKRISEGDILKGTVIGITETEVALDLGYYTEGIIKLEEISNDPRFSIKADVAIGDEISALVLSEDDGRGNILLSKKRADDILAWDKLNELMTDKKTVSVKISQVVNSGVIAYLYGIRAFIPASQLTLKYVEDLEAFVGKDMNVKIITVSEKDRKLVLSGKEVELEQDQKNKKNKISSLQKDIVTNGTVEKLAPYGAFVNIGDGLVGLVHISQICDKRIKSPAEVLKEGDTVVVKIIDIKDDKISLSIKDASEAEKIVENIEEVPTAYSNGEEATTGLAALLKNIKL